MAWITGRGARRTAGAPSRSRRAWRGAREADGLVASWLAAGWRRAKRPSRRDLLATVAGLLVAVFLAGGLAQVRLETGVDSFLPADDPALAPLDEVGRSFGADPIVVLLESPQPREMLQTGQLERQLDLEKRVGELPDVAALYGPVTTLNNIAGRAQQVLAELLGRRDGMAYSATRKAREAGATPDQAEVAGLRAQAEFDNRYAPLIVQGLPVGLPTLRNPKLVSSVLFDSTGAVRPRWQYVVPNDNALAILVRPRADLDQAGTQKLVAGIREAVGSSQLPPGTKVTVSGVPAIVAALGESVEAQIPIIGAIAIAAIGLTLFLVPWTGRRRRLLPLAVTVLATGLTVATLGWVGHPLSLGVLAFLPVLLGLGSYYPTYFAQRARSRVVFVVAGASALSFATLALAPLAFVRDLGITLAIGIAFAVGLGAVLVRRSSVGWGTSAGSGTSATDRAAVPVGPPAFLGTATRRVRLSTGAAVGVLALVGWSLLATLPLQTNIQDLARGLPALSDAAHVQDVVGSGGELNVVLRAAPDDGNPATPPTDVRSPAAWAWMQTVQQQVGRSHGDQARAVLSVPDLLDFLGPTPTADQIQAGIRLMPDSLVASVIRSDGRMANMSYGVSLDDVAELSRLTTAVRGELPPPPPGFTADVTGLPTLAVRGYQLVDADRYLASVAGVIAAGIVLLAGLRRRVDGLRAIAAAILATGASLLVLWASGTALSPLTVALGSLTAAVGCEFTVMMAQSARQADRSLHRAVMLAAATSAIGYAVLAVSPLALMRGFGLLLAVSVGLSYAAAVFVVWSWPPAVEGGPDGVTDTPGRHDEGSADTVDHDRRRDDGPGPDDSTPDAPDGEPVPTARSGRSLEPRR